MQSLLKREAVSITYSECVSVALGIQHAMRMRRIILSCVPSPRLQHFSALPHKLHGVRKELLNTKCVLILSAPFVSKQFSF